ncbi:immunoglobulin alpha-2 heavy chain-like [Huso huso]
MRDFTGYCYSIMWFRVQRLTPVMEPFMNAGSGDHFGMDNQAERTCSLTLTSVRHSATFYCAFVKGSSIYLGNGSALIVTNSSLRTPSSIAILSPSAGEVQSIGSATLVSLVFGVSEQARVYWDIAGSVRHGLTDSGSEDSSESTLDFIRNQITIPGEVWSSGAVCTCVVETESGWNMSKTVTKIEHGRVDFTLLMMRSLEIVSFLTAVIIIVAAMHRVSKRN